MQWRRPRPVDETGSRRWRSAPVFAREHRRPQRKSAKRKRGRSQASRATAQAKQNTLTNAAGATIIRVKRTTLNGTPGSITQVEHAHDYLYTEDGKLSRPARELTDQERKENADIL